MQVRIEDLIIYLKENIDDEGFEIYSCWAGDEWEEKEFDSEIELQTYAIPEKFCFREKELIMIKK